MEKLIKSKRDSFDAICYVIKALALFFCFYPLFDVFFKYSPRDSLNAMDMRSMITSILLLLLVFSIWLVLQPNHNTKSWRKWLEICVFYFICFASILASGASGSSYKFLFIFMVVTYTIQYGMRYGLIISIAATMTLLGMDLVMPTKQAVVFQSDLALSIMFIIISYILGRYVRMENEHIDELMHLANYDGLTNLYNHRYFHEAMENQWKNAVSNGQTISLLMMDIDYFKMFNDIRGHLAGDSVLTRIADLLNSNARLQDITCRYGGEEFVMILPDTNIAEATELAEKIRTAVMNEEFEGEEYLPGQHLTISLGVAESDPDDANYNEVVTRADNALYRAKYLRKNRVETYKNFFDRFDILDEKTKDSLLSVRSLVGIINLRDDYTYSHTERVVYCCELTAKYMGLSEGDSNSLLIGAYMHDVGKINIPREVLISGHKLEPEEWQLIQKHPMAGKTILSQITGMDTVGEIVSQHHERFDGKGYPRGLSGNEIHPLASILALADSFDAMTNERPYQKKRTFPEALEEIRQCSGTQFNPRYAELFVKAIENELAKGNASMMEAALKNIKFDNESR